jgi:hypothetical protein
MVAMRMWAEKWHPDIDFKGELIDMTTHKKIKQLRFRTTDNQDVAPENVRVEYTP